MIGICAVAVIIADRSMGIGADSIACLEFCCSFALDTPRWGEEACNLRIGWRGWGAVTLGLLRKGAAAKCLTN